VSNAGVTANAGTIAHVDFKMLIGKASEVIEVTGEAAAVNTEDSKLATTVSSTQISNLPLNGRNVFDLMQLSAGAVNVNGVDFENGHGTVVNGVNANHVSFNGGAGGITARPNAAQLAAAQERHVGLTSVQRQQEQLARGNNTLRASVNGGRPPIAATPKAGMFSGRAVVAARGAVQPAHESGGPASRSDRPPPGNRAAGAAQLERPAQNHRPPQGSAGARPQQYAEHRNPPQPARAQRNGLGSTDAAKLVQLTSKPMPELKQAEEHRKIDGISGITEFGRQGVAVLTHVPVGNVAYLVHIQFSGEFLQSLVIDRDVAPDFHDSRTGRAGEIEGIPNHWRHLAQTPAD